MGMTIDNLRVDYRVTVLRDFTDSAGNGLNAGDTGVLRALSWDQRRMEIHIGIEGPSGLVDFVFPLAAKTGPRNGHMQTYFELGEDVSAPRANPVVRNPVGRKMPVFEARETLAEDGLDRQGAAEEEMRRTIPHIGAAASIAEMYAQRMRAFRRAGNEPRAVAAFKLAVEWMQTYAGWATSGGEGAALSRERDQFHAALVREFGYDPDADER